MRWALAILCLCTLAYWSLQFHPFHLPNNDYYSFERSARQMGSGELPQSYKRMPVFPGLMAVVAPAMPEPHPELNAALVLNIGFSIGVLILLYSLGTRTLGQGAILLPLFFATTIQFHCMGLQPLVEPSLGFFTVLVFVLLRQRSPWQYAAVFVAALGRYEVATLIPILFLVNAWAERDFRRHLVRAGLASIGVVVWVLLGALSESGTGRYLALMEGMGWTPAPTFVLRIASEAFAGLYVPRAFMLPPFLLAVVLPCAVGVWVGLREFRRDTLAMLLFIGVHALVIVAFGIDKDRYVYPTLWIPLLFFALGLMRLVDWLSAELRERIPERIAGPLAVGAAALWLAASGVWVHILLSRPDVAPWPSDLAFTGVCVALAVPAFWRRSPTHRPMWVALVCGAMILVTSLLAGGMANKKQKLFSIRWANYPSYVLAQWLEEELLPNEGIVVLGPAHIHHLIELERDRVLSFGGAGVDTTDALAAVMQERGTTHVAYTWREPVRSPSAAHYYRVKRVALAERFRDGKRVPGFEHVATLPVFEELNQADVQVYRLRP